MLPRPGRHAALVCLALVLACSHSLAQTSQPARNWWNQQWPYRVLLDCPASSGSTARAIVNLAGRTTPDGSDLRLIDESGKQRPFEIIQHDSQLQTTLAIKVQDAKSEHFSLYFGNPHPDKINPAQPDQRNPLWHPDAGVILRTYRKPRPQYPKSLPQLLAMVREGQMDGGGFVPNISNGYNRFGLSDQYLSVYEASLRIDTPGTYAFCSASADGSWVIVNGKTLVEWPGPHNWQGSERGQMNGKIDLQKGVASVRYYHEAGAGPQLAFMGWKPPGAAQFAAIPPDQWVTPRDAVIGSYESRTRTLMAVADIDMSSTYWLPDTIGKQVSMIDATDHSSTRGARITRMTWDFADGQTASGSKARHVFFRMGRPTVTLTVTDADGNTDSVTSSPNIVLVDVQAADERFGNPQQYAMVASGYNLTKMPQEDLALYTEFWERLERWKEFVAAAREYMARFPDTSEAVWIGSHAADVCADFRQYNPKLANELYEKVIPRATQDPDTRERLVVSRGRNLAWNLNQLDEAKKVFQTAIQTARRGRLGIPTVRNATIGLGDCALLGGDVPGARQQYEKAEQMFERKPTDQATELAKLGSYPWAVDDYLARGQYDEALTTLDDWETGFPLQKLEGTSLLLRGKVLFVRQPSEPALKYLELAEVVNPSNPQVPEAVWLRANCLAALGKKDEAIKQFTRVMTDFTKSEFADKAKQKLAEIEKK